MAGSVTRGRQGENSVLGWGESLRVYSHAFFGLTNAPATFQRMMSTILKGVKGCLGFLDDIIIFADTWEEHHLILEEVLGRIWAAGLKFKREKCQFGTSSVKFLGHVVSAQGTEPDPEKVKAVQDFPTPTSASEVRCFLGMASYYRCFVNNFASIAALLQYCDEQ